MFRQLCSIAWVGHLQLLEYKCPCLLQHFFFTDCDWAELMNGDQIVRCIYVNVGMFLKIVFNYDLINDGFQLRIFQ